MLGGITVALASVIALVLLEAVLRLYNPWISTIRGDLIVLDANKRLIYEAPADSLLTSPILHEKNNIGFRGVDYDQSADMLRVITVGGSTTESVYLNEGFTWTDLLGRRLGKIFDNLWINNAGFTGHSTYAHLILLDEFISKYAPDVLIFLIGINDVLREDLDEGAVGNYPSIFDEVARRSELAALLLNLSRSLIAEERGISHNTEGLRETWLVTWEIGSDEIESINRRANRLLGGYALRVRRLVEKSRAIGAVPILVTQPVLYGEGIDDRTGLDLSRIHVDGVDGATAWAILEKYNDVTRTVADEEDVLLVDLARKVPKNSRLFYDTIHFTEAGARMVAEVLYREICPQLANLFPAKRRCFPASSPGRS